VVGCGGGRQHARAKRLDRGHSQRVARCDLGLRVVANDQNLTRTKLMRFHDGLERLQFALGVRLINGVDMDLSEKMGDAESLDLALLQAAKAGGDQEELGADFGEDGKIAIAVIGWRTSIWLKAANPAERMAGEKPYLSAMKSKGNRQQSAKAARSRSPKRCRHWRSE